MSLLQERIAAIQTRNHVGPHDHDERYSKRPLKAADIPAEFVTQTEGDARYILGSAHVFVRKTADESVTSSTVLQDDDHLFLAIGANETWELEIDLKVIAATTTPDIKFTVIAPTGANGYWWERSGSAVPSRAFGESVANGNIDTQSRVVPLRVLVRNGATAGSVKLQWAQNVSDPGATTVQTDSFLTARRVA